MQQLHSVSQQKGPRKEQTSLEFRRGQALNKKYVNIYETRRDRNSIQVHEKHLVEKKRGEAIKRIGKLNAEMAQRMQKSFPPLEKPGLGRLDVWRLYGSNAKEKFDAHVVKEKGGVYLPPRRTKSGWKGGIDGKGTVAKYRTYEGDWVVEKKDGRNRQDFVGVGGRGRAWGV